MYACVYLFLTLPPLVINLPERTTPPLLSPPTGRPFHSFFHHNLQTGYTYTDGQLCLHTYTLIKHCFSVPDILHIVPDFSPDLHISALSCCRAQMNWTLIGSSHRVDLCLRSRVQRAIFHSASYDRVSIIHIYVRLGIRPRPTEIRFYRRKHNVFFFFNKVNILTIFTFVPVEIFVNSPSNHMPL